VKFIRKLFRGVITTILFLVASVLIASIGNILELKTLIWPVYWPLAFFAIPGLISLPIIETIPWAANVFVVLFPEGGASGVFGVIFIIAFIVWVWIFSVFDVLEKVLTLTKFRNCTA